jgi:L-alanine-DL-glutamate epimerase-like enolase superfamily enzyme
VKIESVTAEILRYDLDRPMADAQIDIGARIIVLVRVRTSDGVEGIGEAGAFGGAEQTVKTIIETQLAPLLIGEDPRMIEHLWVQMYQGTIQLGRRGAMLAAISGADIALWDALGKTLGAPLYLLLGGNARTMPAYASGGFYMPDKDVAEVGAEFAGYRELGYRAGKMKIAGADFNEDVERVRAVRAGLGPDADLMIDANNQYGPREAIRFARAVEDQDIFWYEEPVPTDDLAGARFVRESISMPVAGYETETSRWGFKALIEAGAVDIVQADTVWAGGITECRRIAAFASAWNLPMAPHNFAGAVSGFANLHLLASLPGAMFFEMDQNPNPLRTEIVTNWPVIDAASRVSLPEGVGLGMEIDEAAVARYRVG